VLGETVGLDETALLDPQPPATNGTSAVSATANLERKARTNSTSVRPLIDDHH
jgi:hypothetical protein